MWGFICILKTFNVFCCSGADTVMWGFICILKTFNVFC